MSGPRPVTQQLTLWRHRGADPLGLGNLYIRSVRDGQLRCVVAEEPMGWHLSISFIDDCSRPSRYPTWDEIADARYRLLPDDINFVMHLPPPGEYVALHPTTFHLYEHPAKDEP